MIILVLCENSDMTCLVISLFYIFFSKLHCQNGDKSNFFNSQFYITLSLFFRIISSFDPRIFLKKPS